MMYSGIQGGGTRTKKKKKKKKIKKRRLAYDWNNGRRERSTLSARTPNEGQKKRNADTWTSTPPLIFREGAVGGGGGKRKSNVSRDR